MTDTYTDEPIVVLGAGPAGMAAAMGLTKAGFKVRLYERYAEARPAGNILNLWPPALFALEEMGVDIQDLGAPCHTTFRDAKGNIRATVNLPQEVIDRYQGGFIGLLRPDLHARMLEALPKGCLQTGKSVEQIRDLGNHVEVTFADGKVVKTPLLVGADGIDSMVRKQLWPSAQKRAHDLHVIGGFTYAEVDGVEQGQCILSHSDRVQGTYSSIKSKCRTGQQWWLLEAWPDKKDAPEDIHKHAQKLAQAFSPSLQGLVANTELKHCQRWPIRDIVPMKQWSKGRIALVGDAAHATSPYAAYGAGMSICDGYYLGQCLYGVELSDLNTLREALLDFEKIRIPHTTDQVNSAYFLGRMFHHMPFPLTYLRDAVLNWTPMLQKNVGERNPREISAQLQEMGNGICNKRHLVQQQ